MKIRIVALAAALACALCAAAPALALADVTGPGTDSQAIQLLNDQFRPGGGEDEADAEGPTTTASTATSVTFTYKVATPALASSGFEYAAYVHPVTGSVVKITPASTNGTIGNPRYEAWTYNVKVTGLKPNTSYKIPIFSVFQIDGAEVASAAWNAGVATQAMSAATPRVTKIAANKVRATVDMPASLRTAGAFKVSLYAGSTCIKTWTSTAAASYTYVYKKAGAAKKSYKTVVTWTGGASVSATSAAVKAAANVKTWSRSTSAVSYGYSVGTCLPTKVSYNKKGKLVAKVRWVNTLLARAASKLKVKVTVKCQGKTIATQTFTSKAINRMATKAGTLTFKKAKKNYDLRNGNLAWNVKLVKAS